jgi:cytochrome c oxidase subunit III
MSASTVDTMPASLLRPPFPIYNRIGSSAILLFISTEATLFAMLFATYWYLGKGKPYWPMDDPPKLHYAIAMLILLLASSGVLHFGEVQLKRRNVGVGMTLLVVTILMGLAFIALSVLEYQEHLQTLSPVGDVYGSIFYTTTTFHGAHLTLGLLMLLYVLFLPSVEPREATPYRPYHNAALYWHFVDVVWVFVVIILYIIPNLGR